MVSFSLLAAAAASALVPGILAAPGPVAQPSDDTPSLMTRQGYFWSYWSEGTGNYQCTNGAGSTYTANWNGNNGGFVCGKGWSPGTSRDITYSGTYEATGPGYLAIYGWTRNPLVEYYVVESHADLAPNEPWTPMGNFTANDGVYEVFESTRVNKPSIEGTRTFQQYWSVRVDMRVGGTVSMGEHFAEWERLGMGLGYHDYQILAVEGYTNGDNGNSGSADLSLD